MFIQRFSHFVSLSDYKWKSASHLDTHGVLCETHKISRESKTNVCELTIESNDGGIFGEYQTISKKEVMPTTEAALSTKTSIASAMEFPKNGSSPGNFGFSMDSAVEMENCFQVVECGKQFPILFIQITAFNLSLVSIIDTSFRIKT